MMKEDPHVLTCLISWSGLSSMVPFLLSVGKEDWRGGSGVKNTCCSWVQFLAPMMGSLQWLRIDHCCWEVHSLRRKCNSVLPFPSVGSASACVIIKEEQGNYLCTQCCCFEPDWDYINSSTWTVVTEWMVKHYHNYETLCWQFASKFKELEV